MSPTIGQITPAERPGQWKFDVLDGNGARLFSLQFPSKQVAENTAKLMEVVVRQVERIDV